MIQQRHQLLVKLADTMSEMEEALQLRHQIFRGDDIGHDHDPYDDVCDHLLVVDSLRPEGQKVVGNYRLIRQEALGDMSFYSSSEFDLSKLMQRRNGEQLRLLELGRSCIHPDYRNSNAIKLLWNGIIQYAIYHRIDLLFGCASFHSASVHACQESLSFLYQHFLAPPEWRVTALPSRYIKMNQVNQFLVPETDYNHFIAQLPPLIKGYIRLGAWIGDGAVIDEELKTVDVFITLPFENISPRYMARLRRMEVAGIL